MDNDGFNTLKILYKYLSNFNTVINTDAVCLLSAIKLSLMLSHARTLSCKFPFCTSPFDFSEGSGQKNSIIKPLIEFIKILMIYNPIKEYLSIP